MPTQLLLSFVQSFIDLRSSLFDHRRSLYLGVLVQLDGFLDLGCQCVVEAEGIELLRQLRGRDCVVTMVLFATAKAAEQTTLLASRGCANQVE